MQYVLPFILAMAVTMAGLPLFVRLANKWLLVDQPGGRKVHAAPVPRVGGLAMACGVLVAAVATLNLQPSDRWLLLAAAVMLAFGVLDDRFDIDYRLKLIGQIFAVSIVVFAGGVQIHSFTLEDSIPLPEWIAIPLTVFFLVGITNAINLADGLDGLAGGTIFLCLCAVALLSSIGESGHATALALTFAGAVLGFLRFNTYPASVFMGDAGSQMLGFVIGVLCIRATQNPSSEISATIPILLLALPILDTLSVMVQRIGEGRSPFSPDRNHIHHKLLALGFQHYEAVTLIYTLQAALFVAAYFLRFESDLLILLVVSAFYAVAISLFQLAVRTGWRLRPAGATPAIASESATEGARLKNYLPLWTSAAIAIALAVYASLALFETPGDSSDIRLLILALLMLITTFLAVRRTAPLLLIEKGALFSTATMLVYLDAAATDTDERIAALSWAAIAVAAAATAIRLRLRNDRRFRLTPLDLIVVFMALIVPSIPGVFRLPHGGALAIIKLVIVFYALEMLIARSENHAAWMRIAGISLLAALTLRSFGIFR
jgi:UDP-GlcNAc:undecaprenyl-phosphate GlcNAc-1-phosphate transferase